MREEPISQYMALNPDYEFLIYQIYAFCFSAGDTFTTFKPEKLY